MGQPPSFRHAHEPTITTAPDPSTAVIQIRQQAESGMTAAPELCGWVGGTSAYKCDPGFTCKFNTDYYAAGCCSDDECSWQTVCCGYDPNNGTAIWDRSTTSVCGNPETRTAGYCDELNAPFCGTFRFENGYTIYYCTDRTNTLTKTILFTSAGETTAQAGILKFTGSNGPALATTTSAAVPTSFPNITSTSTPSPGVIAGSAVGGAAFGAIVTLLVVLLTSYFRRRKGSGGVGGSGISKTEGLLDAPSGMSGGSSMYHSHSPSGVGGVSPNTQYSSVQYSVPPTPYSGQSAHPTAVSGSVGVPDQRAPMMIPIVEAPEGGVDKQQYYEMPVSVGTVTR